MDKQEFLFGHDPAPAPADRLVIGRQGAVPLTKAQRVFNRLVKRIEENRAYLERETARFNVQIEFLTTHLHPLEQRIAGLRKAVVRRLFPLWKGKNGLGTRQRRTLQRVLSSQLNQIAEVEGGLVEDDLKAVFTEIEGLNPDEAARQDFDAMRGEVESVFDEMGVEVDLSQFAPDMSPEEMARQVEGIKARFERKMAEEEARRAARPKTKRELAQEAREKQMAEMRKKDLGAMYRQLAKLLHPDLEQDPVRREQKVALMQELTAAYQNEDLHTLLKLELAWIQREEGDLARLTAEKLAVYNEVLREQAEELEASIRELPLHPRYQPLARYSNPHLGHWGFDGPALRQRLEHVVSGVAASLEQLDGPDAIRVVREIILEHRRVHGEDIPAGW